MLETEKQMLRELKVVRGLSPWARMFLSNIARMPSAWSLRPGQAAKLAEIHAKHVTKVGEESSLTKESANLS